ncbi:outer membrane protein [Roseobacteraceae bacterium NS-SX3]
MFAAGSPALSADWSGFFLGPFAGAAPAAAKLERKPGAGREVQLGYNQDFGAVVLGGEVFFAKTAGTSNEAKRVQLRAGYDFGDALGYVTLGNIKAEQAAADTGGAVVGFGMAYSMNQALQVSGELLRNGAALRVPGGVPQGQSLALQAAFRF